MPIAKRVTVGIWVRTDSSRLHRTLASIRQHTPTRCDLVLLPDRPEPAVVAALEHYRDLPQLTAECTLGAAACFNRLTMYDQAEVIVFLESGTIVTPSWLEQLVAALDADPCHGLAGPSTNMAWNEQQLPDAPPAQAAPLIVKAYAQWVAQSYQGVFRSLEPLYSLSDFCYAVKREVIEAIGGSDEQYGLGPCWEMDYNIRATRAGFKGIWACGTYVHRLPLTLQRRDDERRFTEANKQLYQRKFCGLHLGHGRREYAPHCEGDACTYFAPKAMIPLHVPLTAEKRLECSPQCQRTVHVPHHTPLTSRPVNPHVPLVSCIMPTYNRRLFVPRAIRYFLQQDYPHKELVIVDDGHDAVADLIPTNALIQYIRLDRKAAIGTKRNMAVQQSQGEIIVHWDDDDWYAANRIRYQIEPLLERRAEVSGLKAGFLYDILENTFWLCDAELHSRMFYAEIIGGSIMYRKELWEKYAKYPDVSSAEDAAFLRTISARARIVKLPNPNVFIYLRHQTNTWAFICGNYMKPQAWKKVPPPHFLSQDDLQFYHDISSALLLDANTYKAKDSTFRHVR